VCIVCVCVTLYTAEGRECARNAERVAFIYVVKTYTLADEFHLVVELYIHDLIMNL